MALEAASETVALSVPATPAAVTITRPLTADRLTAPPPMVSDPLAMATLSTEAPLPSVVCRMVTSALSAWPRIETDARGRGHLEVGTGRDAGRRRRRSC